MCCTDGVVYGKDFPHEYQVSWPCSSLLHILDMIFARVKEYIRCHYCPSFLKIQCIAFSHMKNKTKQNNPKICGVLQASSARKNNSLKNKFTGHVGKVGPYRGFLDYTHG